MRFNLLNAVIFGGKEILYVPWEAIIVSGGNHCNHPTASTNFFLEKHFSQCNILIVRQ